jgi:thymidylate kinase
MNNKTPILVLVRGIPGSGKSYLVEALKKQLDLSKILILDPDKIDLQSDQYLQHAAMLSADGVEEKFHPYRYLRAQAHAAIEQNKIIFWTQAFTNLDGFQKTVINLTQHATDNNKQLPVIVVEISVSENAAKSRVADRVKRGKGLVVGDDAFARFTSEYRSFADEGYNVLSLDGQGDIEISAAKVIAALRALGS